METLNSMAEKLGITNSSIKYANDTEHLNDYFWENEYKTEDIKGVQKVLGNLAVDGDIGANTAEAIASYAKANNLTLEQASDRLVELGRKYNEIEKIGLNGEEIKQIQIKLNNFGFTDGNGNKLEEDTYLGESTVSAIDKYASSQNIKLEDAVDKLLNRDTTWKKINGGLK